MKAVQTLLISIIRFYRRHFTAHRMPVCRFYPTCSEYAIESIRKNGVFGGGTRALLRVMRCHPLAAGGYDPPRLKQEKLRVDE
ncbi:MAG: membrane protein insertion efficiency factor YidD [Candidatus Omnitrophica bacterium]|nr:membrane protein insertion efficiency factor YidD [Candidatus Omnitrophota bacterium]